MAAVSWLKYAYLAYFSKPRSERQLFRLVKLHKVCRIVEVGIGNLDRTTTLIGVAQRYSDSKVAYTGLDWFEARSKEMPKITLKQSHTRLQATGARCDWCRASRGDRWPRSPTRISTRDC